MLTSKFVWYDLISRDKEAALAFYSGVFGWSVQPWKPEGAPAEMPAYTMVGPGEEFFGGVNALPEDVEVPSHWMGHIHVDDLDAALAAATEAGAKAPTGIEEVPTVGRMAMIIDPQGAVCSLFTPQGEAPTPGNPGVHGHVGWNELIAAEPEAAGAFYGKVVGWKTRAMPNPGSADEPYYLMGTGKEMEDAAGMMKKPAEVPSSAWFLYFTVDDMAAACAKVKELGGTLAAEPFDVPTIGQLAVGVAPDGSHFGMAQWAPME